MAKISEFLLFFFVANDTIRVYIAGLLFVSTKKNPCQGDGRMEIEYASMSLFGRIIFICGAVLLPLGLMAAAFWYGYNRKKKRTDILKASQQWLATTGKVLKSRIEVDGGEYTSTRAYVLYEYEVRGQMYQSSQIRPGDRFLLFHADRNTYDIVEQYPVGATVTVYYDPANPSESALER
jgi:hypothetical protein